MSNPQIASNSSSSLLSTISSSSAVMTNPYVYSQTSNVSEFTSTQWVKTDPQSGTYTSNSTVNFDIAKMGLVGRCILDLPFEQAPNAVATDTLCPNYPIWAIQEIVLSSQGRTISRLDRSCIMARIGERPNYTKSGIEDSFLLSATGSVIGTSFPATRTDDENHAYLTLDFAFNDDQYALDTLFLQSCRISVVIGNLSALTKTTSSNAFSQSLAIATPALYIQYKNQNQMSSDALTSANYSSGLLSSILPTMVSESVAYKDFDATEGTINDIVVNLKETSCVENIYVMAIVHPENSGTTAPTGDPLAGGDNFAGCCIPLHISGNIVFSSNGQNWFDLPARLIGTYGWESQEGRNAYSNCPEATLTTSGAMPYVYCLNMSQGGLITNHVQGLLSMRELSNPTISFKCRSSAASADKKVGIHICYSTRQLATVVASSGQYNISLSN